MEHRLNSGNSKKSVNEDGFNKIQLINDSKLLPVGEVSKIINIGDQFNVERQNCPYYRITGTINPLFTNVLFNTTGDNSWASLNSNKFRDVTFPPNGLTLDDEEDLTYSESIDKYLDNNNSWYGFKDPDSEKESICTWVDMEPNRTLFDLASNNKNWELIVTYPALQPYLTTTPMLAGGIQIILSETIIIGGRDMTLFNTPIKHGLAIGDTVDLRNFNNHNNETIDDSKHKVVKLGEKNGDNSEYYFSVDIPNPFTIIEGSSRMARIYNGKPSVYYYRKFERIKTKTGQMKSDDYEIFPLAFSQTIFEDKINQFVINEDIDVSGLVDNLNRPLTEVFITLIKTNSDEVFTNVKSGINIPHNLNVEGKILIPDIRRVSSSPDTHKEIDANVLIDDPSFIGDIVEYNELEQKETVLSDIYHTFNTINRETEGNPISNIDFNNTNLNLGIRREGYIYKPHHKIKIREFSSYIEQGTINTLNVPNYRTDLKDGRLIWRDLLDIGFNDMHIETIDYPFLNNSHYIHTNISLPLKRQDPFNLYKLQYTNSPGSDISGDLMDDNNLIKNQDDVC